MFFMFSQVKLPCKCARLSPPNLHIYQPLLTKDSKLTFWGCIAAILAADTTLTFAPLNSAEL